MKTNRYYTAESKDEKKREELQTLTQNHSFKTE